MRCAAHYERNREQEIARHREYYQRNRETMLAKMRERSQRDEVRAANAERAKRWKKENREHLAAESRKRYQRIKKEHAVRVRSWKDRNPDVWREINRRAKNKRRSRRSEAIGNHTLAEWMLVVKKQRGKCKHCGSAAALERDHIIPLSLGGSDMICNIQGLCKPCNISKSASIAEGQQIGIFDRVAVQEN